MTDTRETERTVEGLREAIAMSGGVKPLYDGDSEGAREIARAIVEYLGVTEDDVRAALPTPAMCDEPECVECRPARALALLLEASR